MSFATLQTSNPALTNEHAFNPFAFREAGAVPANVTTMSGVIGKTTFLVTLAMLTGIGGYWFFTANPGALWIGSIVAFIVTMGIFFVMYGKPQLAMWLAPLYAVVQGAFLGGVTGIMEQALVARLGQSVPGGLAFQALVITGGVMAAMLMLYRAGLVRPTKLFVSVVSTATLGIMLAYLASFVLSLFGVSMPLISLASTFETGTAGWIGLGLNVVILAIASFWLVIDFGTVEEQVRAGAPKYMEWYCGFALLVSLAWIYWEAVKLVARIAVLFGRRD